MRGLLEVGLIGAIGAAAPSQAATVPFVGCASDGQQGPRAAPGSGKSPVVPAAAAPRLAYYATADGIGVLAPRGWHCFGMMGSNGMTVLVTSRPLDWKRATGKGGLPGPAVQLTYTSGGTSGRFEVARIAARIFPIARPFVARVEAEGMFDTPLAHAPYPADRIMRRGTSEARYTTPRGTQGLGTLSLLAPDALPIDGIEMLYPDQDMDLRSLAVRLPRAQRPLAAVIVRQVAASR